ncbi:VTC domain-containing protein [Streptomyces sp. NPDC059816]|uniref:polyphosphate polymerase domain-containing protein n=1 Tax=Streptomyces sp. NPDC059816 TaxID=3346960 RepID=UPI00364A2E55
MSSPAPPLAPLPTPVTLAAGDPCAVTRNKVVPNAGTFRPSRYNTDTLGVYGPAEEAVTIREAPRPRDDTPAPELALVADPVLAAASISLPEVLASAELLARFDHAYLVPVEVFAELAAHLTAPDRTGGPFRALTIDGRRWFRYHSVYYDTPELRCFEDHRRGRRLRFKIRERVYQDSGERQFEIKLKSGRGETVKHRRPLGEGATPLDAPFRDFLADRLRSAYGIEAPRRLHPSITTDYRRATLVSRGERVTCDAGLRCTDVRAGTAVRCDPGLVLVETKNAGKLTEADRFLHARGIRPAVFTKYCGALAALRPAIPANRWRRAARLAFTATD